MFQSWTMYSNHEHFKRNWVLKSGTNLSFSYWFWSYWSICEEMAIRNTHISLDLWWSNNYTQGCRIVIGLTHWRQWSHRVNIWLRNCSLWVSLCCPATWAKDRPNNNSYLLQETFGALPYDASQQQIDCCARAYILRLIGCVLTPNITQNRVHLK